MTGVRARALAGAAALLAFIVTLGSPRRASADVTEPAEVRPDTYPLVFLFQGDAVVDSRPSGTGAGAGNDPTGGSHLRLRRLRVGDDVSQGAWRARVILEATSPDETIPPMEGDRIPNARSVRLTEAFVAYRPSRAFELDLGGQRVPFSLSRQVDEADLRLPERAQIIVGNAPDYRVGLAFVSDLGLLNVRLAGMSADRNLDDRLLTSGYFGALRIGADPIGPMGVAPWRRPTHDPWYGWWRFSGGVSLLYGTLLAPRTFSVDADAQFQWRRLTITGEYLGQHLHALPAAVPWQGAVLEPGVFVISDRLEIVLRGAWYHQPPMNPATNPAVPGATNTVATGGALTFFARHGHLRAQAGLELRHTLDERLPDSGWAIIRATLVL